MARYIGGKGEHISLSSLLPDSVTTKKSNLPCGPLTPKYRSSPEMEVSAPLMITSQKRFMHLRIFPWFIQVTMSSFVIGLGTFSSCKMRPIGKGECVLLTGSATHKFTFPMASP